MRILLHASESKPEPWLAELQAALPEARLRAWHESDTEPADYAVVWKPPLAVLQRRAGLKAVFNLGAGVDAILQLGDALPANVPIVRLDDAGMGMQMAEYVTYAVLRYFRRFDQFDAQERTGKWRFMKPHDKANFTVGILGLGVLGTRIGEALAHFGFHLNGWSRTQKSLPGIQCYAGQEGFDEFLRNSRVVVCALPLTAQTTGLLNRDTLGKLPKGAYLINVARGAHLVDEDLLALVQNEHIAAATLDVFHEEPLPPAHPFWQEPRITVTPHVAALTLRGDSVRQIAGKIRAMERGEPIAGVVDLKRGY
ncbi:MAG TPA: glyoxylate/hydroxypyruvate reductase A [Burkholderiaceae bacterium]|jgi:glyoxylate/hydroxypyruvate reductase A|nr:glyoxylate/hydroxypyruvate reductase A [Burkholderiaceae bacterium]